MEKQNFTKLLYEAFGENGIDDLLSERTADLFFEFATLLIETNKHTNLTAITDEKDIILK